MSTIDRPRVQHAEGELRFLIYNVGWEGYETLLKLFEENGPRMTYDRGTIELVSPLIHHEHSKKLIAYIIEAITDELDIRRVAAGSTTFKSQIIDRGIEPDECYYLANAGRLRNLERVDMTIDPPPDLAVEIEISRSLLNKLALYAALGIPEVWRYDGETLKALVLGADGAYAVSESSLAFPFLPMSEVARLVIEYDAANDTRWGRSVRAWVRDDLAPRFRAEGGRDDTP